MLDPQARALLERAAQAKYPPVHTVGPETARRMYREMCRALQPRAPEVAAVSELCFPGPGGSVALRLYRPWVPQGVPDAPLPVVVFFHGGGFTIGDLETHDRSPLESLSPRELQVLRLVAEGKNYFAKNLGAAVAK